MNDYKIKNDKLHLHIKYIIVINVIISVFIMVLHFCYSEKFNTCISVASTITSIILSVIAIFMSYIGEKSSNEIRDNIGNVLKDLQDSVNETKLLMNIVGSNTDQLKELAEAINSNNELNMKNTKNINNSEKQSVDEHICNFLNHINYKTRKYTYLAYDIFYNGGKRPGGIGIDEIAEKLLEAGADVNQMNLAIGLVLGSFMTGTVDENCHKKIKEKANANNNIIC